MTTHHPMCPAATRCSDCGCKRCECDLIHRVLADAMDNPVKFTDVNGVLTCDIPPGVRIIPITPELIQMIVAALNRREDDIREAEHRSYREGYNAHATAQQRALIEYGGRPSVPKGSGGMTSDVQMDEVEGR